MNRKRGQTLMAAALVLLLAVGATAVWTPVAAQDADDQQERLADSKLAQMTGAADDEVEVKESIKAFIDKGKPIGHVIILLLIVAIFFLVDQLRVHWLEKIRGHEIYKTEMGKLERTDFEAAAKKGADSRVGRLLGDAMSVFRQSADMSLISAEAEFYREKEEHRFNTFEARMAFLADTAGGLGLLGTVWGIYRGFAAKAVAQSNDDLLAAMGIALVTTFMGIVVSVIINWMSTEMGAAFRSRIMDAMEKIDDYREVLVREIGRAA